MPKEDLIDETQMDADVYCHELRIPRDRIAVLIGTKGSIKSELESDLDCRIEIDSKEGDVSISGQNSVNLFILKDVIKAIGRGFNPDIARRLLKSDYAVEFINIQDYAGRSKNRVTQLKARIIGSKGKARDKIEQYTTTNICVYGKTVGIIGLVEDVVTAKRAIEKILTGSPHTSVFKWLEKKYRQKKHHDFLESMGIESAEK